MGEAKLTGGCNCGAVRFELSEPPTEALYCHCRRCQRRSGAAAAPTALVPRANLRLLGEAPSLRVWQPEDGRGKWFCGDCGSALFAGDPRRDDPVGVRLGAFDDDPGMRPGRRIFTA